MNTDVKTFVRVSFINSRGEVLSENPIFMKSFWGECIPTNDEVVERVCELSYDVANTKVKLEFKVTRYHGRVGMVEFFTM